MITASGVLSGTVAQRLVTVPWNNLFTTATFWGGVDGNLFVDGGTGNPFVPTTGNYNVFINISTSSDSTVTTVSTSSIDNNTLNRLEQKLNNLTALSL